LENEKKILTPDDIRELVRIISKGNKSAFGRKLGVTDAAVHAWLAGINTPSKQKMKALLEMRRALEKMEEGSKSRKYPDANAVDGAILLRESSTTENATFRARQLADAVYETLTPERKMRADEVYIETVMKLKNEQDYEEEGG